MAVPGMDTASGFTKGAVGGVKGLGYGYWGTSEYNPETQHLNVEKANQERELGLESRGQQQGLGEYYQNQLAGKGPTVAQNQLMQGRDEAIKASMAAAAGGRGTNAALAQRTAVQTAGGLTQQAARDSAILRAQEQQAAAKQYSDLIQAQRMQDLLARGYSVDEAKAQLQYYSNLQKTKADIATGNAERNQKAAGGVLTAVGGLLSDEQTKQAVEPVGMGMPRPAPARSMMIEQQTPDIRTTGGGMEPLQMGAPQPEAAGPTFGQRLGNALMGAGGGASGNYQPLIDAMKAQQEQQKATMSYDEADAAAKSGGGGGGGSLGAGLMGAGMSLSDPATKTNVSLVSGKDWTNDEPSRMLMAGGSAIAAGPAMAIPVGAAIGNYHNAKPRLMHPGLAGRTGEGHAVPEGSPSADASRPGYTDVSGAASPSALELYAGLAKSLPGPIAIPAEAGKRKYEDELQKQSPAKREVTDRKAKGAAAAALLALLNPSLGMAAALPISQAAKPGEAGVTPSFRTTDDSKIPGEVAAAEYGRRWHEKNRKDAEADLKALQAFLEKSSESNARLEAERAKGQQVAGRYDQLTNALRRQQ